MAVRGNSRKPHAAVPLAYGAGLALIVDEFALLLDLKDVYWADEGRVSIDLAISTISTVGTGLGGPGHPTAHASPQQLNTEHLRTEPLNTGQPNVAAREDPAQPTTLTG